MTKFNYLELKNILLLNGKNINNYSTRKYMKDELGTYVSDFLVIDLDSYPEYHYFRLDTESEYKKVKSSFLEKIIPSPFENGRPLTDFYLRCYKVKINGLNFDVNKFNEELKQEKVEKCCVCYENNVNVKIEGCNHEFCLECIDGIIETLNQPNKCPLCRRNIIRVLRLFDNKLVISMI